VAQTLAKTEAQLQQQQALLRQLEEQIGRQGKEIDALRQRLASVPDAAADSARLTAAAAALVQASPLAPPAAKPGDGASPLFFRIGNATFTPNGWVDFTAYYRTTDVGSGLGTSFNAIPYGNKETGQLSETRLTAQSSRIGIKVDEAVGPVKAYGYLEADFNGYLAPNAYVSTNSNTPNGSCWAARAGRLSPRRARRCRPSWPICSTPSTWTPTTRPAFPMPARRSSALSTILPPASQLDSRWRTPSSTRPPA
jgi:hypothetical protein